MGRYKPAKAYSQFGAAMGRVREPLANPKDCRLFRLRLDSGGYDEGGAYWGAPDDLWICLDGDANAVAYVRARSRAEAYDSVVAELGVEIQLKAPVRRP